MPALGLAEARVAFVALAQRADVGWSYKWAKVRGINLSPDGRAASMSLAFEAAREPDAPETCALDLRAIESIRIEAVGSVVGGGKPRSWVRIDPQQCNLMWFFDNEDLPSARRFVAAAVRLGRSADEEVAAERQREEEALEEALRKHEADPRRELPERLRQLKVEAEKALAADDLEKAAESYRKIASAAPWWPDAYHGRALILGELGRYDAAISDMRRYLKLEPRARDARHAQDKIRAWEGGR